MNISSLHQIAIGLVAISLAPQLDPRFRWVTKPVNSSRLLTRPEGYDKIESFRLLKRSELARAKTSRLMIETPRWITAVARASLSICLSRVDDRGELLISNTRELSYILLIC
jgi:hypothetical protein